MDSFSRLCSLNPLLAALGARVKVCRVVMITFAGFPMQMRNRTSLDTGDAAYFDFVFSPPPRSRSLSVFCEIWVNWSVDTGEAQPVGKHSCSKPSREITALARSLARARLACGRIPAVCLFFMPAHFQQCSVLAPRAGQTAGWRSSETRRRLVSSASC